MILKKVNIVNTAGVEVELSNFENMKLIYSDHKTSQRNGERKKPMYQFTSKRWELENRLRIIYKDWLE